MKSAFILLLSMLAMPALFAQSVKKDARQTSHIKVLNCLLSQNKAAEAEKTTTGITIERVIAQSTRDNTASTLTDSFNLKYSGLRGSKYDYNAMLYPYNYPYSTSPMFNFLGIFAKPQVLFDTCTRWTVNPFTNVYGQYEFNYANYDTVHNTLTKFRDIFIDSVNNDNVSYANTFNTNNDISLGYWFNLNAGVWDSAFKQYFEYNSSNKLIKDSVYELHLGVWRLSSKTNYTYDGSGNLTQVDQFSNTSDTSFLLPLTEQQKYVNTYDASNRLLTVLTSLYNGTTLAQSMKDTFAYSGSLTYYNVWRQQQYDPINAYWAPIISVQKHITGTVPDTINTYSFDSVLNTWIPQEKDIVKYDAAGNPDTMNMYLYNWTAFPATPNYTKVYYYGTYIDNSSVPNEPLAGNKVLVYPNPATDVVTIAHLDVPQNSKISISLVNATGQVISRQALLWRNVTQISIKDVIPGSYWVVVQNAAGAVVGRQLIVKQ